MGKYNNKNIDTVIELAIKNEREYKSVSDKTEFGTPDYYFFHGKAEVYHDMVHYLVELKKNI